MKIHQEALAAAVALAVLCESGHAQELGTAGQFAVLAGTTVTSTGATVLNGDLGVSPGTAVTGFPPGIVNGTIYQAGPVALQAHTDATADFNYLNGEPSMRDLTGLDLGGLTLAAGGWSCDAAAQLTGILVLDGQGDPNAQFDLRIGSALTTASGSAVILINGARAQNVQWAVGSSATLGVDSIFFGDIIADQSITLNTGANETGRLVALNGAVTLADNMVNVVPEPALGWLVGSSTLFFGLRHWLAGVAARAATGAHSAPAPPPDCNDAKWTPVR